MITLYSSNRLEWLAECLADAACGSSVFESDTVIVQSKGMERWLKLQLAEKNGICANINCPFPKTFIADCLKQTMKFTQADLFSRELLCWRIYEFLKSEPQGELFRIPLDYLAGDNREMKIYQLAVRMAGLFDGYQTFRPDSILSWSGLNVPGFSKQPFEESEHLGWQREVWRRLREGIEEKTFLEQLAGFLDMDLASAVHNLPSHVHIFGISALPPVFMSFFNKLATIADLKIYYLSPCREFWEDCVSERQKLKQELICKEDAYWEVGNPLLASMGALGRDFSRLINGLENIIQEQSEFFEAGNDTDCTLLQKIQNDILTLYNPLTKESGYRVLDDDTSIRINVCHSPMREMEVLYDQILDVLNSDSTMTPRDILVLTPDITVYAPYIRAVFDNPEESMLKIPYSIADKTPGYENPTAAAFLAILKLADSRFTTTDVLEIFEAETVQIAFGIRPENLELILRWVQKSGIRWGIDGNFRKALGFAESHENTWRFGLDRLLMGYAMPESAGLVDGILPMDVEGAEAVVLGQFIEFVGQLQYVVNLLRTSPERSVDDWEILLVWLVDTFFRETPEFSDDIREVLFSVNQLIVNLRESRIVCPVHRTAVVCELEQMLDDDMASAGFLHGGVTFCRLRPMRSVPARMLCLVGMNEGVFPRQKKGVAFDLMAQKQYPGDRNNRLDDRYLFLESLISARDILYLSYVGRSIKDNSHIPPSILVSELVNYIDQSVECNVQEGEARRSVKDLLFTEHPLHAFSTDYFDGAHPGLKSFSRANCLGAKAIASMSSELGGSELGGSEHTENVLEADPRNNIGSRKDVVRREILIADMVKFFTHPARFFIRNVLNTTLGRHEIIIPEVDEPFRWDQGDFFRNSEIIRELIRSGNNVVAEEFYRKFQGAGQAPTGVFGEHAFNDYFLKLQGFAAEVLRELEGKTFHVSPVSIELGDEVLLKGSVEYFLPDKGIVTYHYAKSCEKLYLRTWIEGLCLGCQQDISPTAEIIYRDDKGVKKDILVFPSPVECKERLKKLVSLFDEGMLTSLPFFPRASMAFAKKVKVTESSLIDSEQFAKGINEARKKWESLKTKNEILPGEGDDDYNRLAFGRTWFDGASGEELERFVSIVRAVFSPWRDS